MEIMEKINPVFKNLRPAEILFILDQQEKLSKLLRITFCDLLMRDVLVLKQEEDADPDDPVVLVGKAFRDFKALKHEAVFLVVFRTEPELEIRLSKLIRTVLSYVGNAGNYKSSMIYSYGRLGPYFKSNFFLNLVGKKKLSPDGQVFQRRIKEEIKRLQALVGKEKEEAADTILALGANVLLLSNVPKDLFKHIQEKQLSREDHYFDVLDYGIFYGFDDFELSSGIDSFFDGAFDFSYGSSSFFSGDASDGDGGCGGGGCGGCGGCGG